MCLDIACFQNDSNYDQKLLSFRKLPVYVNECISFPFLVVVYLLFFIIILMHNLNRNNCMWMCCICLLHAGHDVLPNNCPVVTRASLNCLTAGMKTAHTSYFNVQRKFIMWCIMIELWTNCNFYNLYMYVYVTIKALSLVHVFKDSFL